MYSSRRTQTVGRAPPDQAYLSHCGYLPSKQDAHSPGMTCFSNFVQTHDRGAAGWPGRTRSRAARQHLLNLLPAREAILGVLIIYFHANQRSHAVAQHRHHISVDIKQTERSVGPPCNILRSGWTHHAV